MAGSKKTDQRKLRSSRKLNEAEVLELRQVNKLPITKIAELQGVEPSTIWRFLKKHDVDADIEQFKKNRADILAIDQAEAVKAKFRLRSMALTTEAIEQMSQSEKRAWYQALSMDSGLMFDKERLERGQSTSNNSVFFRIIEDACHPEPTVINGQTTDTTEDDKE